MNILNIVGARPQIVKAPMISKSIKKYNEFNTSKIKEVIVHSGQHYDTNMSKIFFDELKIKKPNINLHVCNKSHGEMTGEMLIKFEKILKTHNINYVLVYGDTNTTLAAALACSKLNIRVGHIEAGLRSHNMLMPEEINRIITDKLSHDLFCPTKEAVKNLKKEGFPSKSIINEVQNIYNIGDIMLDLKRLIDKDRMPIKNNNDNFILCTIHRQENTNNKITLKEIFSALNQIGNSKKIIMPLHPNTKKQLRKFGLLRFMKNITVLDPIGYLGMYNLLYNCELVITDSGGLQKEAYFHKKKCLTIRNETEWIETLNYDANVLCPANNIEIIRNFELRLNKNVRSWKEYYGNGNASEKIINNIGQLI